jgi:hypothetical protein
MGVICEIFQSHELKWQVKDCEPVWDQNDQKTVLHNFNVYPDLDFVDAYGNSTYVKYTGADKIRELLLEIHKVVCGHVNSKKAGSAKNEALALPPGGSNLPAVQGSTELATIQKPGLPATTQKAGLPATTQKAGLPATTQKPGLPATIPYDATQYAKEPDDQKLLQAPEITIWYCLTLEDDSKLIHLVNIKDGEAKPEASTLVGTEIEAKGKVKLASGPYLTEDAVKKECADAEKPEEDCCNYTITVKTTKLRMIEEGSGTKTINFRYLMSNNMLKELGEDKVANADKFNITITPGATGLAKLFGASFNMKLEDFQSDDPKYVGNLIVAVIPTLDFEISGNESTAAKQEAKTYNEISARELKRRINELEFSDRAKTMTPEQRDAEFRKLLSKWEEDERRDNA